VREVLETVRKASERTSDWTTDTVVSDVNVIFQEVVPTPLEGFRVPITSAPNKIRFPVRVKIEPTSSIRLLLRGVPTMFNNSEPCPKLAPSLSNTIVPGASSNAAALVPK